MRTKRMLRRGLTALTAALAMMTALAAPAFAYAGDSADSTAETAEQQSSGGQTAVQTEKIGTVTTNGGRLNLRDGASTSYNIIGQLPCGDTVTVIGEENGWYRKDEANRNRLVVDEEAARTVELIFRLRIQGLCNSAIADRLNSMGVLSPMEYKQAQGFNYSCGFRSNEQAEWSPMLVKRILSNEIYIGTLIQHKSGTPNHKIKKRVEYDRDEWIVIENNHEPIICRSDFDTVQNLMLRDVRTAPKQEKVHLFSGFVFCGDCKHTMVRKTVPSGGKKYHYLVCSTNKAGKGCSPHTFSEDKLKSIVLRVVNDHIELIAQVEQVLDYIASLPEQERRIINYDAQMTALENEIKRYQDLKINLYSDMADGVISREEYKEFHAGYDRRIADRQRQLGKLKDERSQAMENSSGNIEWIEQFKKYRHLTELDRECIVHLIEKILIYDGKRIEVCFRYRDELENALQYIERFEDVLPAEEGVTIPERRNA